jgi:hypothetical protein
MVEYQKNLMIFLYTIIIISILYLYFAYRYYVRVEGFESIPQGGNAMVIVEPRDHKLLEPVIKNFDEEMDSSWDLYVGHGKSHGEIVKKITDKITKRKVFLINLETDNLTADEYNTLFKDKKFWDKINAEYILVFQTDTILCNKSIKKISNFMHFDYIGCPFDDKSVGDVKLDFWNGHFYGIGGLSFRKKSFMIDCIEKNPDNKGMAEDVLFSHCVGKTSKIKPTIGDMNSFCTQHVYTHDSFGTHKVDKDLKIGKDKYYEYCPAAKILEDSTSSKPNET